MPELLLDPNIRVWVFLPIVIITFLVGVVRHYVSIILSSQKKIELLQVQDRYSKNFHGIRKGELFYFEFKACEAVAKASAITDASGDSQKNEKKRDGDYMEHNESGDKRETNKEDNVDSVYLRPPPPHKSRSNASTPPVQEDDCAVECLYYTLQCCDCVLM